MNYTRILVTILILGLFLISCKQDVTEPDMLATPIFTPQSGMYEIGQLVTITCNSNNVEIRYTNDGSDPNADSHLYVSPLTIPAIFPITTNSATIKAKAFKTGYEPSATQTVTYSVNYLNNVADPVISPQADSILYGQNISLTCSSTGAQIHYTLDGSEPTVYSSMYQAPITNLPEGEHTIKARAYKETWNPSQIVIKEYIVTGSQAELEISDILDDVCTYFNAHYMWGLMDLLHTEYLHNGLTSNHYNSLWLDRMSKYSWLDIQVSHIAIQGSYAVVYSTNNLISLSGTYTLNEPSDSGDISYFYYENGKWWIYGNQQQ